MSEIANGVFIVLSGPSGVGKTAFLEKILKEYPQFQNTVTYTTRVSRAGEKHGDIYYFVNLEQFNKMRDAGQFAEHAEVHKKWYATSYNEIHKLWKAGKAIIKDLDIQGAKSIKKRYPQAVTIFIYPPNIDTLKKRILKRGLKDINNLEERLLTAQQEMAEGHSYDFKIINDDFDQAWQELKKIIEKAKDL